MTKGELQDFEQSRAKLVAGLVACAEQLKNTAQLAEEFAQIISGLDADGKGKRKEVAIDDAEGGKKRKRSSKPKDPNAPKRPASSYILFQNEIRAQLRQEFPHLSNPELLAVISDKWKNMSEAEKEQYNQTMRKLKEQYSEEKKAYDARSPEEVEAANKATAEAAAIKKANRSRKPKAEAVAEAVQARAPPPEPESDEDAEAAETDEESEIDKPAQNHKDSSEESDASDSEEESEPAPKRTKQVAPKSKKNKA